MRNNEELYVLESIDSPAKLYVSAERYDHEIQAISTELYGNFTIDSQCGKPCDEDGSLAYCIGDDLGSGDQLGRSRWTMGSGMFCK